MKHRQATAPTAAEESGDLTPAEIRGVLFELARRRIDERAARPAIAALNRIMRDSTRARRAGERERRNLR
ncbi:MAG TPA: hypothetical protein VF546_06020 [Pyrinomonadaceae bacterium]|jgi:hypothetical protein